MLAGTLCLLFIYASSHASICFRKDLKYLVFYGVLCGKANQPPRLHSQGVIQPAWSHSKFDGCKGITDTFPATSTPVSPNVRMLGVKCDPVTLGQPSEGALHVPLTLCLGVLLRENCILREPFSCISVTPSRLLPAAAEGLKEQEVSFSAGLPSRVAGRIPWCLHQG